MEARPQLSECPVSSQNFCSPYVAPVVAPQMVALEEEGGCFVMANSYFKQGLGGTFERIYLRQSLVAMLEQARNQLGTSYQFLIFDGFRSLTTQQALFEQLYSRFLNDEGLRAHAAFAQTSALIPYPFDHAGNPVITPHNTGGAVDLTLLHNGKPLDMGSEFDDFSERAQPGYFEKAWDSATALSESRWLTIRHNRRLLINALLRQGFTCHPLEWWHFDFGNHNWAQALGCQAVFGSAEAEVLRLAGF